jgi:uracil-DNA glycosylase
MPVQIEISWKKALAAEFERLYFKKLTERVKAAYLTTIIFPPPKEIFAAFTYCPLDNVRVVILGQDPYHGPGQAHGLAFSVADHVPLPPSLQNIYKEIAADVGTTPPHSGDLTHWANQGVLLLNSSLSVAAGLAASHKGWGWERFTDVVIKTVSEQREHVVFLLWGAFAISKRTLIDESRHLILTAPHPSPLSAYRGFIGCKHFSQTNIYLIDHGITPIVW